MTLSGLCKDMVLSGLCGLCPSVVLGVLVEPDEEGVEVLSASSDTAEVSPASDCGAVGVSSGSDCGVVEVSAASDRGAVEVTPASADCAAAEVSPASEDCFVNVSHGLQGALELSGSLNLKE